ncbi:hypothetical protein JB92DRAFT_3134072 [Gautieria morchelliformis]|nr:hypothetical protein JB92DRAFT_3134072 [Gautieria morchelliformis]
MGSPAPRTKHQREHDMQKSRKLTENKDSGIQPAVCDKPREQMEKRQEEEEEVDERDVVPIMAMTGANLRQEEEESEEEGASNNKGLSTAIDPQSIAGSSASGSEKNERHGQHVPRVTIEEIEDEDCETSTEHEVREEHEDEDESDVEEEPNWAPLNPILQARARPPLPTSLTLKEAVTILTRQSKAITLNVVFRGPLNGMLAFLWFYMSGQGIGWCEASLLAATAAGKGAGLAHSLKSRIEDEDLAQEIHLHLQSLNKKYLKAVDIVWYLAKPEVKERLGLKKTPSECTARQWMHAMNYQYGKSANGMYVDGHEREDVVDYQTKVFLPFWTSIEDQMVKWSNDNEPIDPQLPKLPQQKRIVLVTHDETTFYANDRRKTHWVHISEKAEPVQKGEGASIMVSDFCSPDLGWLKSKDGSQQARVLFKAGKNRDGYFDCADLCSQTEKAIELFEDNFQGTEIDAFGFDNAMGHQKRADDALSARSMPKFLKRWQGKHGK